MEFTTFAKGDTGFHFGTKQQSEKLRKDRQYTNGRTFRAYLNIKNPFRADMDIMGRKAHGTSLLLWGRGVLTDTEYQQIQALTPEGLDYDSPASERLREILEGKGYDGIAYPNGFEGDGYSYMVFHDDQIIRSEIQNFSNESSGAIVGDDDHIVPPDNSSIPKETESVGAAPHGFDPYSDLQYRYGNQPDRANDARPVNVPKKDSYGRDVTEFAANNAPAANGAESTVENALRAFRENGSVSNSTASRILNTPGAVEYLQQNVEFQLPGTASGNRAAVKYALETMAAESTADTQPQTDYDNNTATQKGANTYGQVDISRNGRNQQSDFGGQTAGSAEVGGRNERIGNQKGLYAGRSGGSVHTADSEGRNVTEETYVQLSSSAIRDDTGRPLAVYHSTDNMEFTVFEKGDVGFHFGTHAQASKHAEQRGYTKGRMFRAYLNMQNPLKVDRDLMSWQPIATAMYLNLSGTISDAEYQEVSNLWKPRDRYDSASAVRLREILESKGYDGIVYPNDFEGAGDSYITFHDDQIIRSEIQTFSNERSDAIVGDDAHIVPPGNSSIPEETEFVGAAPQGFDAYSGLQFRYGNQPDRANDARPVNVPVRDSQGKKVSGFAGNAYGAEAVSDRDIKALKELIADGAFGADVQHIINEKAPTFYPARDIKSLASKLFQRAMADQFVSVNLSKFLTLPELVEKEQDAFSKEEIRALWNDYAAGNRWTGYILLMAYSGMMPGELLQARKDQIDFEGKQICGAGLKTKTRKKSAIVLADVILPVLQDLCDYTDGEKLIRIGKDNFYKVFYATLERAGCRRLTPYACRHTAASALAAENIPSSVIQKIMRHAKFSSTQRYIHVDIDPMLEAINKLADRGQ